MAKPENQPAGGSRATKKAAGSRARKVSPPQLKTRTVAKKSAKTSTAVRGNRPMLKSGKARYVSPARRLQAQAPQKTAQPPAPSREKVSLTIPAEVMAKVRERAEAGQISAYVTHAIQEQLDRDNLGDLLADMEKANGPLTDDEFNAALAKWPATQ